jgi:hypothetical protein
LLVSEWRKGFPDDVLALLWSVILIKSTSSYDDRHKAMEQLLNPDMTSEFPEQLFQSAIDRIKRKEGRQSPPPCRLDDRLVVERPGPNPRGT